MGNETTQAASSPAEAVDPFNGETPTLAELIHHRETGELPERFKAAEAAAPAPADAPEETVETPEGDEPEPESDPDADDAQEPPQKPVSPAQKRILQLLADKKELQRRLDAAANQTKPPAPSAAQPQPVAQPLTGPEPTVEDKNADGSMKFGTYEDYVRALARWTAREERATMEREYAERAANADLEAKIAQAKQVYGDTVDDVIDPTAATFYGDPAIPAVLKQVVRDSKVLPHLLFVMGENPDAFKQFRSLAKSDTREAIGRVYEYERGIKEELATNGKKTDSGKAPEKQSTSAPKPPSLVGGGTSRAFDVNDESLSPDEWMRKQNARLAKKG